MTDKKKVLFVEDEKLTIDMYKTFFEKEGYEFSATDDTEEALVMARDTHPDLVLLDVIIPMPENTVAEQGYDFLKIIKADQELKDIPVIVFTNLDTPEDRIKSRDLGAAAYVFKLDCTPKEVIDTVAEVIRRSEKILKNEKKDRIKG